MDLAIVLDLRPQPRWPEGLLDRPFGDADLAELALEKLARLEAPARRFVLATGPDDRARVRSHAGLRLLRQTGPVCDLTRPRASLGGLTAADAEFVLWLNPAYPLVSAERWWRAAEDHHAEEGEGLVSVRRVTGPFFAPPEARVLRESELLATVDAFMIFSPRELARGGSLFRGIPRVFELNAVESRGVRGPGDRAAAEAVWARRHLALPV